MRLPCQRANQWRILIWHSSWNFADLSVASHPSGLLPRDVWVHPGYHGRLARLRERSSGSVHSHAMGGYKFQNLDHLTRAKDVTSRLSESKVYAKRIFKSRCQYIKSVSFRKGRSSLVLYLSSFGRLSTTEHTAGYTLSLRK